MIYIYIISEIIVGNLSVPFSYIVLFIILENPQELVIFTLFLKVFIKLNRLI